MMELKKRKHPNHLGWCSFFFLLSDWGPTDCCVGKNDENVAFLSYDVHHRQEIQVHTRFTLFAQNIKFIMMIRDRNARGIISYDGDFSSKKFHSSIFLSIRYESYLWAYDLWERNVARDSIGLNSINIYWQHLRRYILKSMLRFMDSFQSLTFRRIS